ncbi:MAG: peptidoglycan-binding protein [Corallococcus sp.]|nr:peptidoglycan-binding protein [Corallococcus sp.]
MANEIYYIGANDEHGVNPPTLGKRTPVMPYLNRQIYENQFNRPVKNKFIEACLRNGFRVFDVKPELTDTSISARVTRVNRQNLTLLVTFAYNAFGTGTTFNSASGVTTYYSPKNPRANNSRELSEEVYESLLQGTTQRGRGVQTLDVGMLSNVNCASTLIEAGFMTNLQEAKLMLDWDFQTEVGDEAANGVCRYLGVPFIARKLENYPLLKVSSRGNFVMLLQFVLNNYGYETDIDGIFGQNTQNTVKRYQRDNALTDDGIVGQNTWKNLLFLPPYPTLRQGSRGTYVKYMQSKLESKLYPVGSIDGIFGNATLSALKQFQEENGLNPDGIAGPLTWAKLSVIGGGRN